MIITKLKFLVIGYIAFQATVHAGQIADASMHLLAQTPEEAYVKAIERNDHRLITVPFCGGTTPGFNFMAYQGQRPEENNLGIECDLLLGEEEMNALRRLEAWAARYNKLMYEKLNRAK